MPAIEWGPCDSEVAGEWPELGNRLQCASIDVPADHRRPELGMIALGLIRAKATDPAHRIGSLFMNFGGPGGNPRVLLPFWAHGWASADDTDDAMQPRLAMARRFDLVGVVPRGLRGGWTLTCVPSPPRPFRFIPVNTDEANLQEVADHARTIADGCARHPFSELVNSRQMAHDLDLVRQRLGESTLNYYGISYGTWLGAWYASLYPDKVGRMVLDSAMDASGTFSSALDGTLEAVDQALRRRVLAPIASQRGVWGLGIDAEAVHGMLLRMHPVTRERLIPHVNDPASLVAAVRINDHYTRSPLPSASEFEPWVEATTFSTDTLTDQAVRQSARTMLPVLFAQAPPLPSSLGPDYDNVYAATMCNDTAWQGDMQAWRDKARDQASRFPKADGEETFFGMLCSQWKRPDSSQPDISAALTANPIVMVQSEFDEATPLVWARRMLHVLPNARLIIATGSANHGIFGTTRTPCIEQGVSDYFIRGQVPEVLETSCQVVSEADGAAGRNHPRSPTTSRW